MNEQLKKELKVCLDAEMKAWNAYLDRLTSLHSARNKYLALMCASGVETKPSNDCLFDAYQEANYRASFIKGAIDKYRQCEQAMLEVHAKLSLAMGDLSEPPMPTMFSEVMGIGESEFVTAPELFARIDAGEVTLTSEDLQPEPTPSKPLSPRWEFDGIKDSDSWVYHRHAGADIDQLPLLKEALVAVKEGIVAEEGDIQIINASIATMKHRDLLAGMRDQLNQANIRLASLRREEERLNQEIEKIVNHSKDQTTAFRDELAQCYAILLDAQNDLIEKQQTLKRHQGNYQVCINHFLTNEIFIEKTLVNHADDVRKAQLDVDRANAKLVDIQKQYNHRTMAAIMFIKSNN